MRALLLALFALLPLAALPRPKLVVMISVDQLSMERLEALGPRFTGGLKRLRAESAWFSRAYHAHASTETGPGHSVLLSGSHPATTGIPENGWWDPATEKEIYCVEDAAEVLGSPKDHAGPRNFTATTLGEWIKSARAGRSFSLAGKDRAAILMAGRKADGVYWWNPSVGFTTSTAYAQALPAWLSAHNSALMAHLKANELLWSALDGKAHAAENLGGVGPQIPWGLPKMVKPAGIQPGKSAFQASPFFDAAILETAEALMAAEKVGQGKGTDVLALGLSATDYVGHRYGTGGPEMEDQLLRLDQHLGTFLDRLKKAVPSAWVVLSADHACGDFPERMQAEGKLPKDQTYRLDPETAVFKPLADHLKATFASERPLLKATEDPKHFHLNPAALKAAGLSRAQVQQAVIAWLKAQPFTETAVTKEELAALPMASLKGRDPEKLTMVERLRLSYVPALGGDVVAAAKARVLFIPLSFPANHGSPHDYDRHVPMAFWGGPWKPAARPEPACTVDLAPTLAKALGLKIPSTVDGVACKL